MNNNKQKTTEEIQAEKIEGKTTETNPQEKTEQLTACFRSNSTKKNRQFYIDRALLVRQAIRANYSVAEVAERFQITKSTVWKIISLRSVDLAGALDQYGKITVEKNHFRTIARVAQTYRECGYSSRQVGLILGYSRAWTQRLWHKEPCKRLPLVAIELEQTIIDIYGRKLGKGPIWVQSAESEGKVLVYKDKTGMPTFVNKHTLKRAKKTASGEYYFAPPKEITKTAEPA